jgi:Zn-dependent membrane protease YugP
MFLKVGDLLANYYDVINKDTGEKIHLIQKVDDKIGFYETLILNEDGSLKQHYDNTNKEYILDTETKEGNIELRGKNLFFKLLKRILDIIRR